MSMADKARIEQALDDLDEYRSDGEDVSDNLQWVAEFHKVPIEHLKKRAESKWGAPIETDRIRNADFFEAVEKRIAQQEQKQKNNSEILAKAGERASEVWVACMPDGEPDWAYCANKFLEKHAVVDEQLVQLIRDRFRLAGKNYSQSRMLYQGMKRLFLYAPNN